MTVTDGQVGIASGLASPLAWYNSTCGEIGDICVTGNATEDDVVAGYTVQRVWSNALQACIATNPNRP